MTFDILTLIGALSVLFYMILLVMFSKTKSVSKHNTTPITDRFINKAIRYRRRGTAIEQPVPRPCQSCA